MASDLRARHGASPLSPAAQRALATGSNAAEGTLAALRANPILERELKSRWRRPLTYVVLFFYAAALSWVASNLAGTAMEQSRLLVEGLGSDKAIELPGAALFKSSVSAQVLIALWASALLCAPAIARERELGMLPSLVLANLSPAQIVRGKWLATLGFALVLLLIPLPLQALAFLMGGVSPAEWVAGAALQVAAMVFGSALGLWCSSQNRRVAGAMSGAVATSLVASVPLGGWLLHFGTAAPAMSLAAVACLVLAAPLVREAQIAVREMPLDPPRDFAVVETPQVLGASVAPASGLDGSTRDAWWREKNAEESSHPTVERVSEMLDGGVPLPHREPWILRALRLAGWHNPLVWRELRVRLREPFFDLSTVLSAALCLVATPWLLSTLFAPRQTDPAVVMWLFWLGTGVACALRSATAFTREREQKMLESLLLSTMSPWEIVRGKVAAPILLTLHAGALPFALFALWLGSLGMLHDSALAGLGVALVGVLGCACSALLGASCGVWLSFWCRTSSVSSVGSLALFLGLLAAPNALLWVGNEAVQNAINALLMNLVWRPLSTFDGSTAFWGAAIGAGALLVGTSMLGLSHIARALRPQAVEREGRSVMHTDLTRNLH